MKIIFSLYEESQTISEPDGVPLYLWESSFVATQFALMADRLTEPHLNGLDNQYIKTHHQNKKNYKVENIFELTSFFT